MRRAAGLETTRFVRKLSRMTQMDRDQQTYAIIGSAMEGHRTLGSRFLEPVYQAALATEFGLRAVAFAREVDLPVHYKSTRLSVHYRTDFIYYGDVLVELKAMARLTDREASQVINYLAVSRLGRGILLNFGSRSLQYRRFVNSQSAPSAESAGTLL